MGAERETRSHAVRERGTSRRSSGGVPGLEDGAHARTAACLSSDQE